MKCPCDSGEDFAACCEPYLKGEADPETPEQLMRSRYAAFHQKNLEYVIATTDPQVRHGFDFDSAKAWMDGAVFTRLEVLGATREGNKGTVEFKAHYRAEGADHVHHEHSKFRRQGGLWYFRDGRTVEPPPPKAGD